MTSGEFFGVGIVDDGFGVGEALAATSLLGRDVGALLPPDGPATLLVEGELLVSVPDDATYRTLQRRTDLALGSVWDVPAPPPGADPARLRTLEAMPRICTVTPLDAASIGQDLDTARLDVNPTVDVLRQTGARITSPGVVGTLALAQTLRQEGLRVGLNTVATPNVAPEGTSREGLDPSTGAPFDPYTWPEITGRARLDRAWQLLEAYRLLGGSVVQRQLAVVDRGFWVGSDRTAQGPAGQPTEFPNPLIQWDVASEGRNGVGGSSGIAGKEWHGQWVSSIAAGPHDDRAGVAGAGGQVVQPWFFRTTGDYRGIVRAVQLCTAWGIDVVNISSGSTISGIFETWTADDVAGDVFEWARDNGVVVVAAAGNDDKRLPDLDVRPATRTAGVIAVGALRGDIRWYDSPGLGSNFGESVDIWAEGASVHAGPTPASASVTTVMGTSFATPLVSGTIAMLLSVKPLMKSPEVLKLLQDTGFRNLPGSDTGVAMDAAAALWELMGKRLPDDVLEGGDAAGPRRLVRRGGIEEPLFKPDSVFPTALSVVGDVDWYTFTLDAFTWMRISCWYAAGLGTTTPELVPDDPQSRALAELTTTNVNRGVQLSGYVAPGTYRVKVYGQQTIYELEAGLRPSPLQPDGFEGNDTQATAVGFKLGDDPLAADPFGDIDLTRLGPGTHDLTLKSSSDADWIRVDNYAKPQGHQEPLLTVSDTDAPVTVEFYDAEGKRLKQMQAGRQVRVTLPPGSVWVRFTTAAPAGTRFRLRVEVAVDVTKLPPHDDLIDVSVFGKWWQKGVGVHIDHPPVDETGLGVTHWTETTRATEHLETFGQDG